MRQRGKLAWIGKEVDRLDEDDGAALEPGLPINTSVTIGEDIDYIAGFPQEATAHDLRPAGPWLAQLIKATALPRDQTARRIRKLAEHIARRIRVYANHRIGEARVWKPRESLRS